MNEIPQDTLEHVYQQWCSSENKTDMCLLANDPYTSCEPCIFYHEKYECDDLINAMAHFLINNHLHPELFI